MKYKLLIFILLLMIVVTTGCSATNNIISPPLPPSVSAQPNAVPPVSKGISSNAPLIDWENWGTESISATSLELGELFLVLDLVAFDDTAVILYCDESDSFRLGIASETVDTQLHSIALDSEGWDIAVDGNQIVVLHKNSVSYFDRQLSLQSTKDWKLPDSSVTQPTLSADGKSILWIAQDNLPRIYNIADGSMAKVEPLTLPSGGVIDTFSYISKPDEHSVLAIIGEDDLAVHYLYYDYNAQSIINYVSKPHHVSDMGILIDKNNLGFWSDWATHGTLVTNDGLAARSLLDGQFIQIADLSNMSTYKISWNLEEDSLFPLQVAQSQSLIVSCAGGSGSRYYLLFVGKD